MILLPLLMQTGMVGGAAPAAGVRHYPHGQRRRIKAAERIARRRIRRQLEGLERLADEIQAPAAPVATIAARAEERYERIRLEIAALPDMGALAGLVEAARAQLAAIHGARALIERKLIEAHRKRLLADDEWLMML